ncbi:hypothetical protein SRHO_G00029370 [Serrasalmus rhombeus]
MVKEATQPSSTARGSMFNGHLGAPSSELAQLDRQITTLPKKQYELFWQKSQLEAARDVSPLVVAPASSFRTPGDVILTPAPHGSWERQHCRGPCRPSLSPQPIFTSCNRFTVLSSPPTHSPMSYASTQDSVRHIRVKGINSHATVSCFPSACVLDIAKHLSSALSRHNAFRTVVIHARTNDISDRRSEVLKEHYQTLLDTARKKMDARIIIAGSFPTYRRGSEQFNRLFGLQSWLHDWGALNGLGYVDNWSSFWDQPVLYRKDGLHLNHLGSVVLLWNIERAIINEIITDHDSDAL